MQGRSTAVTVHSAWRTGPGRRVLRWLAVLGPATFACAVANAQPQPQPHATVALSVELAARPNGATLTIELSDTVPYEVSTLTRPDRLVIDLPRVIFANGKARAPAKAGPVSAWRYGLVFLDRSRIVMDLSEPALIEKVDATGGAGRQRLVFQIAKTDAAKFAAAARRESERRAGAPAATGEVPAPDRSGLPLVVIDPGHGGIDSGAAPRGVEPEKVVVLALSQALAERLRKGGKATVAMTRDSDVFVPLAERVKFARDRKAALMVSIHADTLAYEPGVRGASVYTLSEKASDTLSQRLAESENRADQVAGIETKEDVVAVGDILLDLTLRETRHFSLDLARQIVTGLQSSTALHKNPLRSAGFRVLRAPDVPSVLVESGFLSSAEDAALMATPAWRAQMAEAIATAIEKHLGENATGIAKSAPRP